MNLIEKNKQRWDDMSIPASKGPTFKAVADRLTFHKSRYETVSKLLKDKGYTIPWEFIAVAHYREAGFDKNQNPKWDRYLGNGQPLNKKTTIVPKGRGPFATWEEGAVDALIYAPPYAAKNKDWSIGGTLTKLEEYNGLGYASKNLPSPYLWAGTNQYVKGKYVADGKYDPNHVDTQLGCAGLLRFMGYGAVVKPAVVTTAATGSVVAVGGAAAALSSQTVWDHISSHIWAYGIGAAAFVGFLSLIIYAVKNKGELSGNKIVD